MATLLWLPDRDVVSECLEKEHRIIYQADLRSGPGRARMGSDVNLRDALGQARAAAGRPLDAAFFRLLPANTRSLCVGVDGVETPLLGYFIDVHAGFPWMSDYAAMFDHVFCAFKEYMPFVRTTPWARLHWLPPPAGFTPDLYGYAHHSGPADWHPSTERPYDVAFVGSLSRPTYTSRAEFLEKLRTELGEAVRCYIGTGSPLDIYSKSKIVLNFTWQHGAFQRCFHTTLPEYLNPRVFDAAAAGAMLLTDVLPPSALELFTPGTHLVRFDRSSPRMTAELIRHYLLHPEERLMIATAGWEKVWRNHSPEAAGREVSTLLAKVLTSPPDSQPKGTRPYFLASALIKSVLWWTAKPQENPAPERMAEARRLLGMLPPDSPFCWAAKILRLTSRVIGATAPEQMQAWTALLDDSDARVQCLAAGFLSTLCQLVGDETAAWHLLRRSTGAFLHAHDWIDVYLLGHLEQLWRMWSALVLNRSLDPSNPHEGDDRRIGRPQSGD